MIANSEEAFFIFLHYFFKYFILESEETEIEAQALWNLLKLAISF
jgi:hypothetical protein